MYEPTNHHPLSSVCRRYSDPNDQQAFTAQFFFSAVISFHIYCSLPAVNAAVASSLNLYLASLATSALSILSYFLITALPVCSCTARWRQGDPNAIVNLCKDKDMLRPEVERIVQDFGMRGLRALAVGRRDGKDGEWRLLGLLTFLNAPRPDSKEVRRARKHSGLNVER